MEQHVASNFFFVLQTKILGRRIENHSVTNAALVALCGNNIMSSERYKNDKI